MTQLLTIIFEKVTYRNPSPPLNSQPEDTDTPNENNYRIIIIILSSEKLYANQTLL